MYTTALLTSPVQPWEIEIINFLGKKKLLDEKVLKFLNEPIAPKKKKKHLNAMLFTFKMVAIPQTREKSLKIFSSFFPLNLQVSPPTPA